MLANCLPFDAFSSVDARLYVKGPQASTQFGISGGIIARHMRYADRKSPTMRGSSKAPDINAALKSYKITSRSSLAPRSSSASVSIIVPSSKVMRSTRSVLIGPSDYQMAAKSDLSQLKLVLLPRLLPLIIYPPYRKECTYIVRVNTDS